MTRRWWRDRPWDRRLWGVEWRSGEDRLLIGGGWGGQMTDRPAYPGEPTRPLLFTTRAVARRWCATEQAKYTGRTDTCATWRFRPVRVRETVRVL